MSSPSLLCRVKALYPFESNDPSSLRFEEGDFIDVLAKLPSGWWDGWCNGQRGWFPSNYVKIIEEYAGSTEPVNQVKQQQTNLFDDSVGENYSLENALPSHWIIQTRQDGRASYFLNTLTGEMRSTWPSESSANYFYDASDDEDSGSSTIESNPRSDPVFVTDEKQKVKWNQSSENTFQNALDTPWQPNTQEFLPNNRETIQSVSPLDSSSPLTWRKLSIHVTLAINNLILAVKNGQKAFSSKQAASVVDAVRFMLVSSGTMSRESIHIKTNYALRSHHRAMMASMSKLVLSARLCTYGTANDVGKLLTDCRELLIAVRNFINTCESIPVQVSHAEPIILSPEDEHNPEWEGILQQQQPINSISGYTIDQGIRAKYQLRPELKENLDAYGASVQESIESLMASLNRHSDSRCSLAVLLFTQYRNFSNQNGQFLSIVEDTDFQSVAGSPLIHGINLAKQKLYDGLGKLFFSMQTMTDENIPMDKIENDMQEASDSIISSVKSLCNHIAELVIERNQSRIGGIEEEEKKETSSQEDLFACFLRNSTGSFNLNLSSELLKNTSYSYSLDELLLRNMSYTSDISVTNGKRSKSLTMELRQPESTNLKSIYRASAPISDLSLFSRTSLHRSTTVDSKHSNAKLKQFFGDEVPEPSTAAGTPISSTTDVPMHPLGGSKSLDPSSDVLEGEERFLQYDYSPNEIVFTVDGSVKGGTLRALVERMTLHDYLDMNFNSTFLLTYRSFCTSLQMLELLEERYNIQPPPGLTAKELETWVTKKQKLIRLRVFNLLKIWLEQYYYEEDSVILDRLLFFTNTTLKETLSFSAYQLERLIEKRKNACKDLRKLVITQQQDMPDPILPRNLKKFRLLDLDPIELARQLTLMDFKLYSSIKPVECLDKAWSRDSKYEDGRTPVAANIQASINYCNQVTTWVSDEILSQSEVKKRSILIKYWVNVAERCRQLNNFNTCMAILSAFDNSSIGRLKRTWELVGARTHHVVSQIRKLMGANRNFTQYRALIHSVNPPCIPFLGIYLQDLTFIEDGNPNFLKISKNLINFAKRVKTAEVIREIQQYQTMAYHFRQIDEIQAFITENLRSSRDEDQLYKESLRLEPKERDDEKITRLLQESGFL